MDLGNVKNWYAANLKGNAGRYMKTSSLIVTYNDLLTTGGHNLSSRISRVNKMTGYKQNRGGYTPTDYPQENEKGKPTGSKPAKKHSSNHSSNQTSKQSSNQTLKQSSNHNVRPRKSVISSAPRKTRGL
jgi:hypothetical protein